MVMVFLTIYTDSMVTVVLTLKKQDLQMIIMMVKRRFGIHNGTVIGSDGYGVPADFNNNGIQDYLEGAMMSLVKKMLMGMV